jgi:ferric-dicitrate binding protein FerR (iron transport regulator)
MYPGQMLSYGTRTGKVDLGEVDVNNYISWIYGYLLLQSESLDRVLQKLERHYNIPFVYDAADFRNIYVSGKLDLKGSPENALKYISITAPISYTISGGKINVELATEK